MGHYSSMIPRFSPIIAAWVRSLAPSLDRRLRGCIRLSHLE